MTGVIVLGLIAAYAALFVFLFKKARSGAERMVAILFAVLIPLWDLPIGYISFRIKCEDSGLQTFGPISPQKSLYFLEPISRADQLLRAGLDMVEDKTPWGGVRRYTQSQSGAHLIVQASAPLSEMQIRPSEEIKFDWHIHRHELRLEEVISNKVLARARAYDWRGGWIQNAIRPSLPLAECGTDTLGRIAYLVIARGQP